MKSQNDSNDETEIRFRRKTITQERKKEKNTQKKS